MHTKPCKTTNCWFYTVIYGRLKNKAKHINKWGDSIQLLLSLHRANQFLAFVISAVKLMALAHDRSIDLLSQIVAGFYVKLFFL